MFLSDLSSCPIGLDISDLSFKFVQLKKKRGSFGIQALGRIDIPKGVIEKGSIKNQEKALSLLKNLFSKPKFGKITTDRLVACLPEAKTFIKLIEIKNSPNEIEDLIETEIKKHIPLEIKDMYYDWQLIKESEDDHQLVLVGAAPKQIVNQYISFLDEAGFSIEALEIEPVSICRSLLKEEFKHLDWNERKNYIILDIGAARSSIVYYSKNTILFTASIPVSVSNIKEAQKESFSKLKDKINESLEFYNINFKKRGEIDKVYIVGGGAGIEDLKKELENIFSIDVEVGDPLININNKKLGKYFSGENYYLQSFTTAIGLALCSPDIKK